MRFAKSIVGACLATIASISAGNAAVYHFDYSSLFDLNGSIDTSGTFTTDNSSPIQSIVGISGTVNGASIQMLTASPVGLPTNGLIYSPSSFVTDFSFTASDGLTYEVGNAYDGAFALPSVYAYGGSTAPDLTFGTLTISAVPLPAALPMFGAALLALGAIGLKTNRAAKRRQPTA